MNSYILRTQPPDRLDVSDLLHTIQDLSFCDSQANTPKMDLYFPDESAEPRPVILNVCGGGWYFGISTSVHLKRTLHTAVQRGYVFASIACTSSRYQKFPYQVWEVKAAIRYLRANAEVHHLDPNRIVLWSASSGAHLSLMAALTCGIPEFDDPVLGTAIPYLKRKLPATGSWTRSTSGSQSLHCVQDVKRIGAPSHSKMMTPRFFRVIDFPIAPFLPKWTLGSY